MVLAVSKDRYAVRAYVVGQAEPREIAAPSGWAARDWFQTMWNSWSTLDGLLPVHTIEMLKNGEVLRGVTQQKATTVEIERELLVQLVGMAERSPAYYRHGYQYAVEAVSAARKLIAQEDAQ